MCAPVGNRKSSALSISNFPALSGRAAAAMSISGEVVVVKQVSIDASCDEARAEHRRGISFFMTDETDGSWE